MRMTGVPSTVEGTSSMWLCTVKCLDQWRLYSLVSGANLVHSGTAIGRLAAPLSLVRNRIAERVCSAHWSGRLEAESDACSAASAASDDQSACIRVCLAPCRSPERIVGGGV